MIAAATAARETGDWPAACAAAGVDVSVDLVAVRREHGPTAADALADELAHFAPDLLRWHMPRVPESLALVPWASAVLTPAEPKAPLLQVLPPTYWSFPQRLRLRLLDRKALAEQTYYDAPRHLWDARRAPELREAWGGSASRPPLLHADGTPVADERLGAEPDRAGQTERILALIASSRHREAWRMAGIIMEPFVTHGRPYEMLEAGSIWPVGVADEARRLAEAYGISVLNVAVPYRARFVVSVGRHGSVTARLGESATMTGQPHIATPVCQLPVDLELLRGGLITPDELHPLVRASLFPGLGPPTAAPDVGEPPCVRVRCRGVWHRVQVVDGRITAIDHDPDEERREIVVRALGGTSAGCFAVIQTWNQGRGRLPRLLRSHRTDIFDRAFHGDTAFVVSMLDAGRLDPRTRDGMGRTLLHMLAHLDYEAVLPRLLAAGVPVDARDHEGRTPLFAAVVHHGSVELIRALRDAGADPRVTDNLGRSARDWIRITRRPHLASILE
jgi:Ankyrin repeats (many copies)